MPAVPGSVYGANQQPTCWSKMKTGFTIGFCVGMASGALFGGFGALRYQMSANNHSSYISSNQSTIESFDT